MISKIKDIDLELLPISMADIEKLRLWKNLNKEYFFLKKDITRKEQINWYKNTYIKETNNQIFIVKYQNIKIGTLGYRLNNNCWDIYNVVNINDEFKGKGIMSIALNKLIHYLKEQKNITIVAKVLITNNNINWYLKNNFKITSKNKGYYQVTYKK